MAFPDVLDLLRDYLAAQNGSETVVTRVPSPRPVRFIQVRHAGGTDLRPVRVRERFDVFTWAADEPAAQALALTVRGQVHALAGTTSLGSGVMCYAMEEFLAPRPFDDLLAGAFRSWATYQLDVRANDAIAH